MNFFFSAKQLVAFFLLLAIFAVSTSESAVISRIKRQARYGVIDNVVNDGLFGGSPSLGWAQVPHVMSPMFSPVFGR